MPGGYASRHTGQFPASGAGGNLPSALTVTVNTPGLNVVPVPAWATGLGFSEFGAGAGGAGNTSGSPGVGGGGGGGGWVLGEVGGGLLVRGSSLVVVIGAAGKGGDDTTGTATAGGDTSLIVGGQTIVAGGGQPGLKKADGQTGGAGGVVTAPVHPGITYTTIQDGTAGNDGNAFSSKGAGGLCGDPALGGGAGGAAGSGAGADGNVNGGGGAGAGNLGGPFAGGDGAACSVVLTWKRLG